MEKARSQPRRTAASALLPENLAGDFAAKTEVTRHGVQTLYGAVLAAEPPAFQQWKSLFSKVPGHDPAKAPTKIEKLAACYLPSAGHDYVPAGGLRPDALLFALHTYYALLVRLLLGQVMAHQHGLPGPVERLLGAERRGALQHEIEQLEAGDFLSPLSVSDFCPGDLFSWYTAAWSEPIRRLIRELAERLAEYDHGTLPRDLPAVAYPRQPARPCGVCADATPAHCAAGDGDLLGQLYQALFPRTLRHELGEYYTPSWLANHLLREAGYPGEPDRRLLDPACGSGVFLVTAIRRVRRWHESNRGRCRLSEAQLCRKILANIVGFDLNPLAVITAKANYLIAVGDLLPQTDRVEIPLYLCDSILGLPSQGHPNVLPRHSGGHADAQPVAGGGGVGRFDFVVGNPPWIAWDNLPADYRRATKPLWQRYGLFSLSGAEARHGGAKKDLSMMMIYASADRFLKPGGRLAMVVTQTLWQTKGAGEGFRRFRLGRSGEPLRVLRVDDMVALRSFAGAANFTSTILLEKGASTRYPVPYVRWSPSEDADGRLMRRRYHAEPIDPQQPGSPWFLRPEGLKTELARLVGPSDYVAHLGANSGGANGIYWVELLAEAEGGALVRNLAGNSRRKLPGVEQVVEADLIYPLLRWSDVARYRALPSAYILLAQDAATRTGIDPPAMRRAYPKTYAYFQRFAAVLSGRAAYRQYQQGKAFYSMYNVGTYTLAPIKVVWRRMDRRIRAAVVEQFDDPLLGARPVIPQETCVLIAAESSAEAHYVCAVLNSSVVDFLVRSHSVCGGKGFGTPSMLDFIKLRRFDPGDPRHGELAAWSRAAHRAAAGRGRPAEIQRRTDELAGELWGLEPSELKAIAGQ